MSIRNCHTVSHPFPLYVPPLRMVTVATQTLLTDFTCRTQAVIHLNTSSQHSHYRCSLYFHSSSYFLFFTPLLCFKSLLVSTTCFFSILFPNSSIYFPCPTFTLPLSLSSTTTHLFYLYSNSSNSCSLTFNPFSPSLPPTLHSLTHSLTHRRRHQLVDKPLSQ